MSPVSDFRGVRLPYMVILAGIDISSYGIPYIQRRLKLSSYKHGVGKISKPFPCSALMSFENKSTLLPQQPADWIL